MFQHGHPSPLSNLACVQCFYSILYTLLIFKPYYDTPTLIGEIQNLTAQAAGIGNNLNQIARYFHGGGLASRGMLEELKKCIAEIRELRQEIVQLGGAYRGNSKTHRK